MKKSIFVLLGLIVAQMAEAHGAHAPVSSPFHALAHLAPGIVLAVALILLAFLWKRE